MAERSTGRRPRWGLGAVIAVTAATTAGALAGCGSDSSTGSSPSDTGASAAVSVLGVPDGVEPPADAVAGAGWSDDQDDQDDQEDQDDQDGLWVVTFGSSSNPQIASVAAAEGQTVTIDLTEAYPGKPATADFVPSTTYVTVPEGVDREAVVTVVIGGLGTVEITDPSTPGWILPES